MNKKIFIISAILLGLVQGCNLDTPLYKDISEADYKKLQTGGGGGGGGGGDLNSTIASAYTSGYFYLSHNGVWSAQEVSSDELMIPQRGQDWYDGGQWIRSKRHEFNHVKDEYINNSWNSLYSAIANCNNLLKDGSALQAFDPSAAKDIAIAEVRALRAHYYYLLMDLFGSVPIFTETTTEVNLAQSTRQEVFDFVESELQAAAAVVPNASVYSKVTYPVVQAMLSRLYLNAEVYTGSERWADAIAAADEVINSGFYNLEAKFEDNFSPKNNASKENIFVVPFDEISVQGNNVVQMTMHYGNQVTYNLQNQPWNGYCTMEEFYNSFDAGDKRLSKSLLVGPQFASDGTTPIVDGGAEPGKDPDGLPLVFIPAVNELEPNAIREAGARIFKFPPKNNATANLDNDFPIYRYSDILLTKAEASFRLGDNGTALSLINQVRTRAGLSDLGSVTASAILAERGRELFAEGVRRTDLIRFGEFETYLPNIPPAKTFGPLSGDASALYKRIYPIPNNALQTNTALVQNPGY